MLGDMRDYHHSKCITEEKRRYIDRDYTTTGEMYGYIRNS